MRRGRRSDSTLSTDACGSMPLPSSTSSLAWACPPPSPWRGDIPTGMPAWALMRNTRSRAAPTCRQRRRRRGFEPWRRAEATPAAAAAPPPRQRHGESRRRSRDSMCAAAMPGGQVRSTQAARVRGCQVEAGALTSAAGAGLKQPACCCCTDQQPASRKLQRKAPAVSRCPRAHTAACRP